MELLPDTHTATTDPAVCLLKNILPDGAFAQARDLAENRAYYITRGDVNADFSSRDAIPAEASTDKTESLEKHRIVIDVDRCIGKGGGGVVYKGLKCDIDGRSSSLICIKQANTHHGSIKSLLNEIDIFNHLRSSEHPNIIGHLFTTELDSVTLLGLEYFDGYNLIEFVKVYKSVPNFPSFPEEHIREIMKQMVSALKHLHDKGVFHCDIKPENILYNKKNMHVKLIDFGLAVFRMGMDKKAMAKGGTVEYMAPETLLQNNLKLKTDIYGLGATLYHLIALERPWYHEKQECSKMENREDVKSLIIEKLRHFKKKADNKEPFLLPMQTHLDRFTIISSTIREIVKLMLSFKSGERPDCDAIQLELNQLLYCPKTSLSRSTSNRVFSPDDAYNAPTDFQGSEPTASSFNVPNTVKDLSSSRGNSSNLWKPQGSSVVPDFEQLTSKVSQATISEHHVRNPTDNPHDDEYEDDGDYVDESFENMSIAEDNSRYGDWSCEMSVSSASNGMNDYASHRESSFEDSNHFMQVDQSDQVVPAGIINRRSTDKKANAVQADDDIDG